MSDEEHGLLEGVGRVGAGVQDHGAQGHVGQQAPVLVDAVQGVQHRLHALETEEYDISNIQLPIWPHFRAGWFSKLNPIPPRNFTNHTSREMILISIRT